jgi:phosphohistidine swiveling domain-containing protein
MIPSSSESSKIEWQWTMKKPQVPLAQGLHVLSLPLMQKNVGISVDLPIKHINGDIYFGKKAVKDMYDALKEKVSQDIFFPDKIKQKIEATVDELKETVSVLEKIQLQKQTNTELIASWMKGYHAIAALTAFMSFKGTVQMSDILEEKVKHILEKKIKDLEKRSALFLLISLPKEDSFMVQERNDILQMARKIQKGSDESTLVEKHTKRFSWMGCVMYAGVPYTKEHFKREVDEELKHNNSKKLQERSTKKAEREKQIQECMKQLQLTKKEKHIFEQLRDWVHLRTYVKDMTSFGIAATLPFLYEIAKRAEVSYTDLLYLSHTELQDIFSQKKSVFIKESRERQNAWGFVVINTAVKYYNKKTINEIEEKEEVMPKGVKGFSACHGVAKGRAIIVKNVSDVEEIKEGDILVTHMTTTNFVPVLSKVSAIVTDEGGITCHAAIVSRELNIPCIIGTRIATKAFKSGDIIEVDADKGIVRKIN